MEKYPQFHTKRYMNIVVETSLLKNTLRLCMCLSSSNMMVRLCFYLQINLALTKVSD